jgi:hypothetical protein
MATIEWVTSCTLVGRKITCRPTLTGGTGVVILTGSSIRAGETGQNHFAVAIEASHPPPKASINATLACSREDSTCKAVSSALNLVV